MSVTISLGSATRMTTGRPHRKAPLPPEATSIPWKGYERFLFRTAFFFFILVSLPNTLRWYHFVAGLDWLHLHYRDLYDISRFSSGIALFGGRVFGSTLMGYGVWVDTLLVSVAGAVIWTVVVKGRKTERREYRTLYYWLRVVVRYRAAIGIIGFGFTKVFPVQLPYPSLGILNTHFGDLTAQKIYWLSIGIVPWYEVFAGVVEVTAGTLLFFRKTTTLGAVMLLGALGDITFVNFAYDGGVHVYASYFVLLSAFLLIPDAFSWYRLFIQERPTTPFRFDPGRFRAGWLRLLRIGLKAATILLFLGWLFYLQYVNFRYDPYKQPAVAGVSGLRGNYRVEEFRINNRLIPYSPLDTVRWEDVTFENWSSMTYRVNHPVPLDLSNGGGAPQRDLDRTFEIAGVGGGRRAFHYYADTVNHVLYLEDKYKPFTLFRRGRQVGGRNHPSRKKGNDSAWISPEAWAHIGSEVGKINPLAASTRREKEFASFPSPPAHRGRNEMILHYATTDGSRIILQGIGPHADSLYIVLEKVERPYALSRSTLQAGTY